MVVWSSVGACEPTPFRGDREQSAGKGANLPLPVYYAQHPLSARKLQGVTEKMRCLVLSKQGLFSFSFGRGENICAERLTCSELL